ncbi:[FeFe] hydrogenase H-cluster radical SAM maturase HydE [Candidatus Falkowbacteria bacterium]|nr:[FeFe] hydrogenase H-cluster radical SAM maturase HydE [Candidatus Falkowbacteria bacterium]
MCLATPAKIVGFNQDKILIEKDGATMEVSAFLLPKAKIGDWILYVNDLAIKKIDAEEAREILRLVESPRNKVKTELLSGKFKKIIEKAHQNDLNKGEIIYLLNSEGMEKDALLAEADITRRAFIKDFICIHGIIEFSNYCENDCAYCGLRSANGAIERYRMSIDEIKETAKQAAVEKGYKLLVLQSGEDNFYTDDMLVELIKQIKSVCRVFIFMSCGERGFECYKKMKNAGASGALLRFETSSQSLFTKIHPQGKNLENRIEHLRFLKELGYFITTGSLIGLPGQTIEDLADDILLIAPRAHMVSMGPFIPCDNTPMENCPAGDPEMNLKMIAVLRLLMPTARIPVTTALETLLGEDGRKRALAAGANALMMNLTPKKYRSLYKIYPGRFFDNDSLWQKYGLFKYEESYKMLEERMAKEIKRK